MVKSIEISDMKTGPNTRRKFLSDAAALAAALPLLSFGERMEKKNPAQKMFVHHVYFWLKNPDSQDDLKKLIEGLQKLSKVKTIRMHHIGKPAPTSREVIDRTYSVSWLLTFDDLEAEESYQKDPIHLAFVAECQHLWSRVVVYDSVDI